MNKIIILGTGGNCIDILDCIDAINATNASLNFRCVGFLDDDNSKWDRTYQRVKVLGGLARAPDFNDCFFVNGIGSPNNFWKKRAIIDKTNLELDKFLTLVHPRASIAKTAKLGAGTVVFPNVTITSNVCIGNHVIILPGSVVSHDDVIGDYTCIAGGASISGAVTIGESCYLGANCSIIGDVKIGKNSMIGMGSVVLADVPENSVVAGNPARFIRTIVEN
jgi:sugar O-acyltransferase (sialic acid O-acetyltransferase NeuD family)